MNKTALIVLALALTCQLAFAGTDYNVCYSTLDSDDSGEVTKSDLGAAFPGSGEAVFESADANRDGVLEHDEWEGWKENQGMEDNHG